MAERIVVLGGTRSGKSAVAEQLVSAAGSVLYVATGAATDDEMAQRIAAHRRRRPAGWRTVETAAAAGRATAVGEPPGSAGRAPMAESGLPTLAAALALAEPHDAVLVDALGPWLAERMQARGLLDVTRGATAPLNEAERHAAGEIVAEACAFWDAAAAHPGGPVVVVADEAGMGLVPPDASARRWLDLSGTVVQRLTADADRVLFVVGGRVLELGSTLDGAALPRAPDGPSPAPDPHTAADLRAHGDRMVAPGTLDFAVNVRPEGPPAHVRAAVEVAVADVRGYPDDTAARAAAAARHDRDAGDVLVTAGAAEAFWLLPSVLRVRHAAVVQPSFTEPEAALRAAGIPITAVRRRPEDGWALDPTAVPDNADLVVVGNPNNPTGRLDPVANVASLCRPGRITVVDEAFMDFVPDPAASLAPRADLPGLVVVRSVTKLWGLAGLRAGYVLASPGLVSRCAAARQPWPVGVDALAALCACLSDEVWRTREASAVAAAREDLVRRLATLPDVTVWNGAANFVLVRVSDGTAVDAGLRARGVAVRPSTFPGLDADHLRITVRGPAENAALLRAFRAVLADTAQGRRLA